MELRKLLILRRPHRGHLEGRTVSVQPNFNFFTGFCARIGKRLDPGFNMVCKRVYAAIAPSLGMSRGIPGYPGGPPRGSAGEAGPMPPRPLHRKIDLEESGQTRVIARTDASPAGEKRASYLAPLAGTLSTPSNGWNGLSLEAITTASGPYLVDSARAS